jgi:hypothetical protein
MPWLRRDLAERGGRLAWLTVQEPKARQGRRETRRLWALADPALNGYVGSSGAHGTPWPHLQQLLRIERQRIHVRGGQVRKQEVEITYAVTSRSVERATAADLLQANRAHWRIENGSHWVRDVVLGEDASLILRGRSPGHGRLPKPRAGTGTPRRLRQRRGRAPHPHRSPRCRCGPRYRRSLSRNTADIRFRGRAG